MPDPRLELLASACHELWLSWAQNSILSIRMPAKQLQKLQKMLVAYEDLPEESKAQAREWARMTLARIDEVGTGFKYQLDQVVRITDARMDARIVSRIEEKTTRTYRVLVWNNGERGSVVVPEDELEAI